MPNTPKDTVTTKQISFSVPQIILIVLLVIAAFLIGTLYTKVQYLEKNGTASTGTNAPTAAKYKSFDDAMAALSKSIKLDSNKMLTCMNGGSKKPIVDADLAEGTALGVNGTPAFYINGRLLGGAFPYASFKEVIDKELAGTATDNVADYSQTLQSAAQQGAFIPKAKDVSVGSAHTVGKAGAPVTIVEYSDFQCPYCEQAFPVVKQILKDYPDKVLLAYKYFPLVSIHPHAEKTAELAQCASDQGKFWQMHDALFQSQSDWTQL